MSENSAPQVGGIWGVLIVVTIGLLAVCAVAIVVTAVASAGTLNGTVRGVWNYFAALRETAGPEPVTT